MFDFIILKIQCVQGCEKMNKPVKAKINWISGNGQALPVGKYLAAARFEDIKNNWPGESWSVVTDFSELESRKIVDLKFLCEWAPEDLFYEGSRFDLFEGENLIANGEILSI
jgi:hypothetical protein